MHTQSALELFILMFDFNDTVLNHVFSALCHDGFRAPRCRGFLTCSYEFPSVIYSFSYLIFVLY